MLPWQRQMHLADFVNYKLSYYSDASLLLNLAAQRASGWRGLNSKNKIEAMSFWIPD